MSGLMNDSKSVRLKLAQGQRLRVMEAHNGLSAMIANAARDEETGREFDALWVSSLTCTASTALPDLEMAIVDNRLQIIRQVVETSKKPVIIDGDSGGDVSALRYFCRTLSRIGAAGIIVEDKAGSKRNSLGDDHQPLADPFEFAAKLASARDAIPHEDLMIIARLESLMAGAGMDDAISRAGIYAGSGVDAVMIHSKSKAPSEIEEFCARFRGLGYRIPIFCVPTTYHMAKADDLFGYGVQGVIYANHQLRAAHAAMSEACVSILRNDRTTEIENDITSTKQLFDEVGYTTEIEEVAKVERRIQIAKVTNSPTPPTRTISNREPA